MKNVKNIAQTWVWISNSLQEFGFGKLNLAEFTEASKKGLGNTNAVVRENCVGAIVTICRFIPQFKAQYSGEKDAIKKQIDSFYDALPEKSAPVPSRGTLLRKAVMATDASGEADAVEDDGDGDADDLMPRVDISTKLSEELTTKLGNSNWKLRKEALDEVRDIFEKNKFVTPDLAHLPKALAKRLSDVNKVT